IASFVHRKKAVVTSVVTRDWDWTRSGAMEISGQRLGEGPDGRHRESYEHGGGPPLPPFPNDEGERPYQGEDGAGQARRPPAAAARPGGRPRGGYGHGRGRWRTLFAYGQGVRRYQREDGAAQASLRLEAHAHDERIGAGIGRVIGMAPGSRFELSGHPAVGLDGEYLITRVEHASQPLAAALPDAGATDPYFNRFECVPVETPYRPRRRVAKPQIPSIQTAVVVGPSGEEIHVDEHGRIKIQFHWDREGQLDEHSSCWVRV